MSSGVELVNQIIYEIRSNPHEYQNYEDLFGLVYDAPGENVNTLKLHRNCPENLQIVCKFS